MRSVAEEGQNGNPQSSIAGEQVCNLPLPIGRRTSGLKATPPEKAVETA